MRLGADKRRRQWYKQISPEQTSFEPETTEEEALNELMPTADKKVFKSHLEKVKGESKKPFEVVIEKFEDDSFYRETYKRAVDDMTTKDADLKDIKDAEYTVEVMQGNESAGAHSTDTLKYKDLPENVQAAFKTHGDKYWEEL